MKYCFDIDGTLCESVSPGEYGKSSPYWDRINVVNDLYYAGHEIILWTGRHWNHLSVTLAQIQKWGVKYHSLVMGKPPVDVYVDDKAVSDCDFFGDDDGVL